MIVEPIAFLAAMLTKRPVKYAYSREEEMQVSSPRAAERIYIKDGVMKDGRIVARKVTLYVDAGAYSRHSPYGTTKAAAHMPGPYTIPNVHVDAHCVYTNRTPSSAMRGFGVTIGDFALEVQMDKLARLVGMDPLEFRILNAYRDGDMKAHGETTHGAALVETMQAASKLARLAAFEGSDAGKLLVRTGGHAMSKARGRGVAAVNYPTGMNLGGDPSQALVHATTTGNFVVTLSSRRSRPGPEDGDGADLRRDDRRSRRDRHHRHRRHRYRPALHGHVRQPRHAPHRQRHHHGGEGGARGAARSGGGGARGRCLRPRDRRQGQHPGEGRAGASRCRCSRRRSPRISSTARTVSGRGMFMVQRSYPEPETGNMRPSTCYAHACTVAEVEVDTETGEVAVLSLKSAYEVGRALNPKMVEQQIVGGAWMGMSHALYETTEPYYPDRAHGPVDFNEYLMPGPGDLPEFESVVLERPSEDGPFGAKGVGEMTANSPIPAIANAIFDAVGVRVDSLPITPEKVLRGILAKQQAAV